MKQTILFLFLASAITALSAQPASFMPEPQYPATGNMFYRFFADQIGPAGNTESVDINNDWFAAIDAQGYVIAVSQGQFGGGFGCPPGNAVLLTLAGQANPNSPGNGNVPAPPYGGVANELIDIVVYDASRDEFFTLGGQATFVPDGTGGSAGTAGCPEEDFSVPYIVPSNPLPVILSAFRARRSGERQVALNWTTVAETNSDRFVVEHSNSNGERWTSIGEVAAAGNSRGERQYAFEHTTPANGENLYRLRQFDFGGANYTSSVALVTIGENGNAGEVSVFPNPVVAGQFAISVSGNWGDDVTSTLRTVSGRVVNSWNTLTKGSNTVQLRDVPTGVYQLTTTDGNQRVTTRVVIR